MSYLALYRKYRPQTFSDFVGQEDIVQSLKYQVETGTYGHSYIFSGIRGTGKTSMARVFAKALNCHDPRNLEECLKDENDLQKSLDIIEIDAASNNGVDDIRDIIENAQYLPTSSKLKVYIIDEVQMLTREARNALLKTLEEPIEQIVFILATTEEHKIPDTIRSRCQHYRFSRITHSSLVSGIEKILTKENIEYDTQAINLIARHSSGSMRDALSMLDRVLSYGKHKLDLESTSRALGLIGSEQVDRLLSHVFSSDTSSTLVYLNELVESGKQVEIILTQLMDFVRAVLVRKYVGVDSQLTRVDITNYIDNYYYVKKDVWFNLLVDLEALSRQIRSLVNPQLSLELVLMKYIESDKEEVKETIQEVKVEKVEEKKEEVQDPKQSLINWAKHRDVKLMVVLKDLNFRFLDKINIDVKEENHKYLEIIEKYRTQIENFLLEKVGREVVWNIDGKKEEVHKFSEEEMLEKFSADTLLVFEKGEDDEKTNAKHG